MNLARVRALTFVVLLALAATACGGDVDVVVSEAADGTVAPNDASRFTADDPAVMRAIELAATLVGDLGDDDAAVAAVLLAGDAGYDAAQIEIGIVRAILSAEGAIAGVLPALAPFGRLASFAKQEPEPVPIELLRDQAREQSGRDDLWPTGTAATCNILALHLWGYSQDQIVSSLILGSVLLLSAPTQGSHQQAEAPLVDCHGPLSEIGLWNLVRPSVCPARSSASLLANPIM